MNDIYDFIEDRNQIDFEYFRGKKIFRPSAASELEIRLNSESHLRNKYDVGKYTQKEKINEILQHQFKFYEETLEELLPPIVSRDLLEFVLHQYEVASQIEELNKAGKLLAQESIRWMEINKVIRRSAKYLAERIILFRPEKAPYIEPKAVLSDIEKIWICVEEMVILYVVSDQTHSIFPENSFLEILSLGQIDYFHQGLTIDLPETEKRVYLDTKNRNRFISNTSFLFNVDNQNKIIGESLEESIGIKYDDAIKILGSIIELSKADSEEFPVLFIHKGNLIKKCVEEFGFPPNVIKKVISGFSLSKDQMTIDKREVWKPKQEYRAYRRAFFEYPHILGDHIVFSKSMAKESLILLIKDVNFGKLPKEWLNPSVDKSLSKLSNEVGKWFENEVERNFSILGYKGVKSAKAIGLNNKRIKVPLDVGEIDYIGYSEKEELLVVAECKIIRDSFEPAFFRKDIDDFIESKKSYAIKFRKKVSWIESNILAISEALMSNRLFALEVLPKKVASILVTFIPTIASDFIDDFTCVSLTEFMLDYETIGHYPYEVGVHEVA